MMQRILLIPIWCYRRFLSPLKPPCCRFHPTCSAYAMDAIRIHGAVKGLLLTIRRLLRCHPFTEAGWDPVPPKHDPAQKPGQPRGAR